jgi:SNF2 family DNA or RNA helicase
MNTPSTVLMVGEKTGKEEAKEVTKLTALIYHQEILNHPALIGCEGESEKMDALLEMLTEGDLVDEKVIIYTRFSKMVDLLMPALQKAGLGPVRVTGAESGDQRQKAQDAFQNPENPCKVICITSAGGEAINLQAAKAIVFYDTPWSAGEYLQVIGRMVRIGSVHDRVLARHLVAKVKGVPTVDQKVQEVIEKKLKLIEAVLGERLKGKDSGSTSDEVLTVTSEINELFDALKTVGKL